MDTINETQEKALIIIPAVSASLSIVGSGCITFMVARKPSKKRTTYHRLLLVMCLLDIMFSSQALFRSAVLPSVSAFALFEAHAGGGHHGHGESHGESHEGHGQEHSSDPHHEGHHGEVPGDDHNGEHGEEHHTGDDIFDHHGFHHNTTEGEHHDFHGNETDHHNPTGEHTDCHCDEALLDHHNETEEHHDVHSNETSTDHTTDEEHHDCHCNETVSDDHSTSEEHHDSHDGDETDHHNTTVDHESHADGEHHDGNETDSGSGDHHDEHDTGSFHSDGKDGHHDGEGEEHHGEEGEHHGEEEELHGEEEEHHGEEGEHHGEEGEHHGEEGEHGVGLGSTELLDAEQHIVSGCNVVGFLTHLSIGVAGYNAALSLYFFLVICRKMKPERIAKTVEPFLHGSILLYIFGTAIASIPLTLFNVDECGLMCYIAPFPANCVGNPEVECIRGGQAEQFIWWFSFGELLLFFSIILVCQIAISWSVHKQFGAVRRHAFDTTTSEETSSSMMDKIGSWFKKTEKKPLSATDQRTRTVATQAFLYVAVFILTWSFVVITRVAHLVESEQIVNAFLPLAFMVEILFPLQGFLNFLVYLRPVYKNYRSTNKQARWYRVLWAAVCTTDMRSWRQTTSTVVRTNSTDGPPSSKFNSFAVSTKSTPSAEGSGAFS